jgi:hypothetical protein
MPLRCLPTLGPILVTGASPWCSLGSPQRPWLAQKVPEPLDLQRLHHRGRERRRPGPTETIKPFDARSWLPTPDPMA